MTAWPEKPFIYEINTWVWLNTLSRFYNHPITLENVPDEVIEALTALPIDAIWLMGVWERSPGAARSARQYIDEYRPALPDVTIDDIVGSPYAIYTYRVDEDLGGRRGLAHFRQRLQAHGLKLMLDFVPNHVALDHPWTRIHPEYFVLGTPRDIFQQSDNFFYSRDATGQTIVIAHGRDPYFPGWSDTAQVNAFSPALREAVAQTLLDIAEQCDGVRCDMAMLMLNEVFARTWEGYVGAPPATDFWLEIIPRIKEQHPHFLFMAEVYWDMEHRLQQQGFDLTYDKRLYDNLQDNNVRGIRAHLRAEIEFQKHLVRFIENHDEERAMATLGLKRGMISAILICTLPGGTLLHDGQLTGRRVKLPVQLGRQPFEPEHQELQAFYQKLLRETRAAIYHEGEWSLLNVTPAEDDNGTHKNLIAYGWRHNGEVRLIVLNFNDGASHGLVDVTAWLDGVANDWRLHDVLSGDVYQHTNDESQARLYVNLDGFAAHLFRLEQ
ncbi:MAG: alpha-amylase [Chloroflexi bacterium]|nr:MAG: alpha-amylase [Chloroflexota bacterium]